jgi:hypothetical protein
MTDEWTAQSSDGRGDMYEELQRFLGGQNLADLAKGIKSQPEDFGLKVKECDELEVRERKSEDYRAKLEEYRLKIAAYVILADIHGEPIKAIQRDLNRHSIKLSYRTVDEMVYLWRGCEGKSLCDDLKQRLRYVAGLVVGHFGFTLPDRENDVQCMFLSGQKESVSLDWLAESAEVLYGRVDVSPDDILYRTQYGEWILVSEPIDWETGEYSIEVREITPAQARAWCWKNRLSLPDSLKGVAPHGPNSSDDRAMREDSEETRSPQDSRLDPAWTPSRAPLQSAPRPEPGQAAISGQGNEQARATVERKPSEAAALQHEGENQRIEAPASPAEEQDTESRVAAILRDKPHAKSPVIAREIGKSEQCVRLTAAWKENRERLKQQSQKPGVHARPLTRAMLEVIDSEDRDPAEIAAEREEQEMQDRTRPDDPAGIEPIEVLKSKYLEGANADERARFNRLSMADQEHEVMAWRWTGKRLAD